MNEVEKRAVQSLLFFKLFLLITGLENRQIIEYNYYAYYASRNLHKYAFINKEVIMEHEKLFMEKKRYCVICIITCMLILAPTLIIGIYDRPSADDFTYAVLTHDAVINGDGLPGILSAAWRTNMNFYNSWQGLYSSAFILALQPAIFGEQMYVLTPFIVMLCGYIFTLLSVHLLNKMYLKMPFFYSITISAVLFTLLIIWLPSATEGLYWYNGAMNYMPWAFTNIFNICLLLYIRNRPLSRKLMLALLFSTTLSFLTSGGNHVTAFSNILQLLFLSVYFAGKKNYYPLLPLIAACIGFAIMYTAPGTAVRADALTQSSIMETIVAVIKELRLIISDWINIQWLLSLIAITPFSVEFARKNTGKFSWRLSLCVLFISVIIICGMFAVPYYAMSSFGAGRVTNVIWITFTVLSWINYTLLTGLLIQKNVINIEALCSPKAKPYMETLLICLGILFSTVTINNVKSNPVRTAIELTTGTAASYCAEIDARFEIYHDPEITEAKVSPIVTGSILFFSDIGTDPGVWPNTSISRYYGKPIWLDQQ